MPDCTPPGLKGYTFSGSGISRICAEDCQMKRRFSLLRQRRVSMPSRSLFISSDTLAGLIACFSRPTPSTIGSSVPWSGGKKPVLSALLKLRYPRVSSSECPASMNGWNNWRGLAGYQSGMNGRTERFPASRHQSDGSLSKDPGTMARTR